MESRLKRVLLELSKIDKQMDFQKQSLSASAAVQDQFNSLVN